MSPKKQQLYGHVKRLYRNIKKVASSKASFKRRLNIAEKFSKEKGLEENLGILNDVAATFIRCQIREANKSAKGGRFTIDEKILALSFYNQGPKAYRFLSKIFRLPSKATLNIFLNDIKFEAGINPNIFDALKIATNKMNASDKFVSVIFDEMAIMPGLHFNEKEEHIQGFEDMGQGQAKRSCEIADHVLVFMVRGIKKKFKQPVSYCFSARGGAKYEQIKTLLKQILEILIKIDLKPITTICDQAAVNVRVIKSLIKDTKENYLRRGDINNYREGHFEINEFKVFPIYDPPHLLKGIRNNFISKNVEFGQEGLKKVAKWDHIRYIYEADNAPNMIQGLQALPHITDEHVYPHKLKKMKVKHAAQIFSQRLASTLQLTSNIGNNNLIYSNPVKKPSLFYKYSIKSAAK